MTTVDIATHAEKSHVAMFNPEPAIVTAGRRFLYDTVYTSANGTQAWNNAMTLLDQLVVNK